MSEKLSLPSIGASFWSSYKQKTSSRVQIIDAFLVYILLTGIAQFIYCILVGTFPFNSFLSGFICTVGCFVLTASLRMQVTASNPESKRISPERAFADYVVCNILLFLVVFSFMG